MNMEISKGLPFFEPSLYSENYKKRKLQNVSVNPFMVTWFRSAGEALSHVQSFNF